jgi:hypothetical protein
MTDPQQPDESGLVKPLTDLRSVLIPSETLDAWAIQHRLFALTHRRVILAATSGRLLWLTRRLVAGFDVANVRWQDLEEVVLHVGIISATLMVRAGSASDLASQGSAGSRTIEFKGLRKGQAQAVYRICQAQDQAWREKRRIRELEELRARSGGVQIGPAGGVAPANLATASAGGGASAAAVQRLQEAKQMLESKLITDSEYEAIKARILAGG